MKRPKNVKRVVFDDDSDYNYDNDNFDNNKDVDNNFNDDDDIDDDVDNNDEDIMEETGKKNNQKTEKSQLMPKTVWYADFESTIDEKTGYHEPCLLMAQTSDGEEEILLFGKDCHRTFVRKLVEDTKKEGRFGTIVFHGLSNYDGQFIVRALHELKVKPTVLYRGSCVLSVSLSRQGVRIIDSYLFFQTGLAKLPAMFGFQEVIEKGFEIMQL